MADDVARLMVTLEASLTKFQRQMDNAGRIADRATKGVADKAGRNLKTLEDRADRAATNINRSLNRVGSGGSGGLQNFSFQLQDIIVQVQGGTDAVRALSQQLPQMLGGFGAMGAVAGVAVGVLGGLVSQLDLFGQETVDAKAAADSFNTAIDATKGLVPQAASELREYKDALSLVQRGYLDLAQLQLDKAIRDNTAVIEQESGKLAETAKKLQADLQQAVLSRVDVGSGMPAAMTEVEEQYAKFLRRIAELRPTDLQGLSDITREVKALAPAFEAYGLAVQPLLDQVSALIAPLDKASQQSRQLADVQDKLKGSSGFLSEAVRLLNGIFGEGLLVYDAASGKIVLAAQAMDQAKGAADRAAASVAGFVSQFERLPRGPTPTAGLSFGGAKPTGFGSGDLGAAMADLYSQPQLPAPPAGFGIPSRTDSPQTRRGGAPSKKAATEKTVDKSDSRLASLQSEIDLNTKLLAAYALGDEALAKIRAQHDAVNSARQIGLKEGTAEYTDYLTKAEAAETENAALEAKLKLMAQGKSLTAEMRTEQEALNAKLLEYKALLDAGAIGQTTYERAVAKAKDQNDSLAQSVGAVGDAIASGIQGATSFADALLKIGTQLLNLLAQGAVGQGPLGGLFNNLLGVAAGGIFGSFGGGATGGVLAGGTPLGAGGIGHAASGGMAGPGLLRVGEGGPELLSLSQRGHVTPANATRRMMGGGSGNAGPVQIVVSGARGNAEIQQMVAAGVAQGVKVSRASVGKDYGNYQVRYA